MLKDISLENFKKVFMFNTEVKVLKLKTKASYGQAFNNYLEMFCTKIRTN